MYLLIRFCRDSTHFLSKNITRNLRMNVRRFGQKNFSTVFDEEAGCMKKHTGTVLCVILDTCSECNYKKKEIKLNRRFAQ